MIMVEFGANYIVHSIYFYFSKVEVVEERDLRRKRERTDCEKCKLYTTRILLNLAVLIILALAGYLVYETTMISAKVRVM